VELVEGVEPGDEGVEEDGADDVADEESLVDEAELLSEDFVAGLSVDDLESEDESPELEPASLEADEESDDLESEEESLELLGA
jgi:hypothetical protein